MERNNGRRKAAAGAMSLASLKFYKDKIKNKKVLCLVIIPIQGVTSNSIVTASFKSGDNGRYIKTVVPSTDTITITLDNPADGGVIMYIVIN